MNSRRPDLWSERGYTLIEMMAVVLVIGILAGMAMVQVGAARPRLLADGAMRSVMGQITFARDTAVSQRRDVELDFDVDQNVMRVIRHNLPNGTTTLSEVTFEGGVKLALTSGAGSPESGFGSSSAADFPADPVFFTTDGSLVDSGGSPVNGAIYLQIPNVGGSSRAVTILGSIGRVRGYRWNGTTWVRS